jgi:hypothetical protein
MWKIEYSAYRHKHIHKKTTYPYIEDVKKKPLATRNGSRKTLLQQNSISTANRHVQHQKTSHPKKEQK